MGGYSAGTAAPCRGYGLPACGPPYRAVPARRACVAEGVSSPSPGSSTGTCPLGQGTATLKADGGDCLARNPPRQRFSSTCYRRHHWSSYVVHLSMVLGVT